MTAVISVEHLSKAYQLGQIGTGTLTNDLKIWWARKQGKPNPLLRIGDTDHGNRDGETLWALKDVSFTVDQGEVLGVIGRNGAGKSTLLKVLSRITAPTTGKVRVKGRVASLLEVGTGFHPELTGRENTYLNGAILGMSRQEITRKFDAIVDFAEMERFIDTPVKRYSSGMYVRLAFAVAAHLEPEILLVDEVLAVGDADFQKKCLGKMGDTAQEGRTVLFVSHNMAAIEQLCQTGILLSNGSLAAWGGAQAVIEQYLMETSHSFSQINGLSGMRNDGSIKLVDFYVADANKHRLEVPRVGEPLSFLMKLSSESILPNTRIGLGINNDRNLRIATLHTDVSGRQLAFESGISTVACHIPSFYLIEGTYNLDLKIYSGSKPMFFVERFHRFTVHAGNIYGTGKLPDPSWGGVCHMKHTWEIESQSP